MSGCAQAQRSEGTPQSSVSSAALVKNNRLPLPSKEPINAQASDHFYDMDYERSIQEFTILYERHPDDPDPINHLLNAVLFHELYRIGALSAGEYANDNFINAAHEPADPKTCGQIKFLVQKATAIENQRLSVNSKDVGALYARGVTRAEFATYTALVEHAWFSALRNAVSARHDHEKVLELDPDFVPALFSLASALSQMGFFDEAIESARKAAEITNRHQLLVAHLANMYAAAGRRAEAYKELDELLSGGRAALPYALSLVYIRLGDCDRALELLEEAFESRNTHLHDLNIDPEFEPLRCDPRFISLVRRVGLDPYPV